MIQVVKTNLDFERELFRAPFGFKGSYVNGVWQVVTLLESANGKRGLGLGIQSVLWSDAAVFASCSPAAGDSLMFAMTSFALQQAKNIPFETPLDLLDRLFPLTYEYGKTITGNPNLRQTFALNALVPVDYAAWHLTAAENNLTTFDALIPPDTRYALSHRHNRVISVPLVSYGMSIEEMLRLVEQGFSLLKIKIGSDPDKDGDQDKMFAWDCERLRTIHEALRDNPEIRYYLDANGRYDSKDRLLRFTDTLAKIGALERTVLIEEPLPEEVKADVRDVPARLAADESAHTDADALERIELGYGAIALKPIAKTLSMSFKIAKLAHERGVPCFCADLTVTPIMVDWNKNVAARLAPLPGLEAGVMETNGGQNYRDWDRLVSYHPCAGAAWMETRNGAFHLSEDFYTRSGGQLEVSPHYLKLVT
jgi:L-alanine-DL-glutamate epimerase-like enolase superfamily enzyme